MDAPINRNPHLAEVIQWAFYMMIVGCAALGVSILNDMSKSISDLNEKVAVVVERTTKHEKELERMDSRIHRIETKGKAE